MSSSSDQDSSTISINDNDWSTTAVPFNGMIDFNQEQQQQQQQAQHRYEQDEEDEDWEEWDGNSPLWQHCVAGSIAGLAEHVLVYPLDTVRTHIQVCASCVPDAAKSTSKLSSITSTGARSKLRVNSGRHVLPQGVLQTVRFLMSEPAVLTTTGKVTAAETATATLASATTANTAAATSGIRRLWRGVHTILVGCIPAHALYFSSYEMVKFSFREDRANSQSDIPWYGSMAAGAVASLGHDVIMSPLDTVKQRLQLGHHEGQMMPAVRSIIEIEGWKSLFRSFPVTLFANVPYGMIMVGVNECIKQRVRSDYPDYYHRHTLSTTLMASSAGGFAASLITTPLDRIKTSLQTQHVTPACWPHPKSKNCPVGLVVPKSNTVRVANWQEALRQIVGKEGFAGLYRGTVPRVLSHTPAVAISWTSYEIAKSIILSQQQEYAF